MSYINKTSLLVPSQLPEFIRDDANYSTFVAFIQAYYEWMEQEGNTSFGSKNLLSYSDIDNTLDGFLNYYRNDFLAFFPEGSLVDQRKLTKIAKELYQTKGTPSSYQFLFRVLYNSDVELYNSKDFILRASDGQWIVTRSLTLATTDAAWLNTVNYRLFGEISKGYAVVEDVIPKTNNTQVVLSAIDRTFTSGEFVRVIDNNGHDVLFNGEPLRGQIVGVLSGVTVDSVNNGSGYNLGDPVVFYGGLNPEITNPVGANGYISSITTASLTAVTPTYYGQGYRPGAFTQIDITSNGGSGAKDFATSFDPNSYYIVYVPDDTIQSKANVALGDANYGFANLTSANITTKLVNALTYPTLNTFGILGTTVTSGGSGYDASTKATATGFYSTDVNTLSALPTMGILGPLTIVNGGLNYAVNDRINIIGGSGYGAYAKVTAVDLNGTITQVSYISDPTNIHVYPLGGMGYNHTLPSEINITSTSGAGATLQVPGLIGGDAQFSIGSTSYGQVLGVTLTEVGQDYIAAPGVSLRVEDLLITNVNVFNSPQKGDVIYQGTPSSQTFSANVDSLTINTANTANSYFSTYNLRVYDYNGLLDGNNYIHILKGGVDSGASMNVSQQTTGIYTNGRKIYGNGAAKAKANFLNGIITGKGFYANADGQPSAYSILENEKYNEYTYILQVEQALSKYKNTALSFLHPSGTGYTTFNVIKNSSKFNSAIDYKENTLTPLSYLLGTDLYVANTVSYSTNSTVYFTNLNAVNIDEVIQSNTYLTINTPHSGSYASNIVAVGVDTITLEDVLPILVPNVAIGAVESGSDIININSITNAWNIAAGNVATHFSDFMHIYDSVSFDGINYKQITHVDQLDVGTTIIVDSVYGSAQSGYITFKANVLSSDVWVS